MYDYDAPAPTSMGGCFCVVFSKFARLALPRFDTFLLHVKGRVRRFETISDIMALQGLTSTVTVCFFQIVFPFLVFYFFNCVDPRVDVG